MLDLLTIAADRFNHAVLVESKVAVIAVEDRGALRTALRYLHLDDGPVTLPPTRLRSAEHYLERADFRKRRKKRELPELAKQLGDFADSAEEKRGDSRNKTDYQPQRTISQRPCPILLNR